LPRDHAGIALVIPVGLTFEPLWLVAWRAIAKTAVSSPRHDLAGRGRAANAAPFNPHGEISWMCFPRWHVDAIFTT
jgi:hypothetical protein